MIMLCVEKSCLIEVVHKRFVPIHVIIYRPAGYHEVLIGGSAYTNIVN